MADLTDAQIDAALEPGLAARQRVNHVPRLCATTGDWDG